MQQWQSLGASQQHRAHSKRSPFRPASSLDVPAESRSLDALTSLSQTQTLLQALRPAGKGPDALVRGDISVTPSALFFAFPQSRHVQHVDVELHWVELHTVERMVRLPPTSVGSIRLVCSTPNAPMDKSRNSSKGMEEVTEDWIDFAKSFSPDLFWSSPPPQKHEHQECRRQMCRSDFGRIWNVHQFIDISVGLEGLGLGITKRNHNQKYLLT